MAGPAAPPGRAASQGVAISVTPEQLTPLSTFARWADQATPTSVNHQNTAPATTISFNLPPGKSLSDATRAITEAEAEIRMPANIHGSFQGTAKVFQQSLSSEPLLILAALVAIYVVLGILYESYVHPLTVLSTLPAAGIGAVIALIVFHTEFSIIALIGVILLIGIVKKNAILMIDFALVAEREHGLSSHDAIRQAALTRFRPIMMTTFAAILGALPLAIRLGRARCGTPPPLGPHHYRRPARQSGHHPADDAGRLSLPRSSQGSAARSRCRGEPHRDPPPYPSSESRVMNSVVSQGSQVPRAKRRSFASVLLCGALAGCLVGPNYHRPAVAEPPAFKEESGWAPAQPSDAAERKDWWTAFGDPILDALEVKVEVSNQNLAAAEAAYRQAHALVAEDRAALFPTVALDAGVTQAGSFKSKPASTYTPTIGASWAPDLWGKVRRTIESARGAAQASAATLANARLSAQTELAADYIALRQLDEEKRILDDTIVAYRHSLEITQNKYKVGVVGQSDVLSARGLLLNTQASDTDLIQQRARMEHAIAILTGAPPAEVTLAPAAWKLALPQIPAKVPSSLLQRRPDIAAAERSAAAANASIGVAVAAYYPNIALTGQAGFAGAELGSLFDASAAAWSIGGSAVETVFDAGARGATVRGARAAYDEAVANYRQTVLTAFGQVEDNLAAQRVFEPEEAQLEQAAAVTATNETITLNEYKAGTVDFTTVVTAQAAALAARNALLAIQANRLTTAVDLIEALGGGWTTADLPTD